MTFNSNAQSGDINDTNTQTTVAEGLKEETKPKTKNTELILQNSRKITAIQKPQKICRRVACIMDIILLNKISLKSFSKRRIFY